MLLKFMRRKPTLNEICEMLHRSAVGGAPLRLQPDAVALVRAARRFGTLCKPS
jgi:hypothetical protein